MSEISSKPLLDELAEAPDTLDPSFTAEISARVLRYQDRDSVRTLLRSAIADVESPMDLRFRAFFALHIHLRRYKDLEELMQLTHQYRGIFSEQPLWPFVESMTLYYCDQSPADLRTAETLAIEATESLPDSYYPLAHRAMVMARRFSRVGPRDPSEIEEAIRLTRRALRLSGERHARFWGVLAELLTVSGRYDEAEDALDQAIEREDSSASDYPLRLSDYQALRISAQVARHKRTLERRAEEVSLRVEGMQSQILGLLGLLAAVVAFLATSAQFATRMSPDDAMRLLVLSAGLLLVVFSGYAATFQTGATSRKVTVGLFGAVIVAASLLTA